MVVEFSTCNYRSLRELQTLQLAAAPIRSVPARLDQENVWEPFSSLKLLKTKAIYGANASGKSNLILALMAMLELVQHSVRDEQSLAQWIMPFLLDEASSQSPSLFELVFLYQNVQYRYGFEATSHAIQTEWLFGRPLDSDKPVRERYYFLREGMSLKVNDDWCKEAHRVLPGKGTAPLFRADSLVLPTIAAFNGPLARELTTYLQEEFELVSGLQDRGLDRAIDLLGGEQADFQAQMLGLLQAVDPTISGLERIDPPGRSGQGSKLNQVAVLRQGAGPRPVPFLLGSHEAEGTKKLFGLGPYLFRSLRRGSTLVVDEFDARLHPNLTRKIVELFHDPVTNPRGGQLIFVTHDSNLLDAKLMRRDQIAFAAKDTQGATEVYSLVEFKGVRNNASFEKDYLAGKYQAVPTELNRLEEALITYNRRAKD
jgi:uncharacterized protein